MLVMNEYKPVNNLYIHINLTHAYTYKYSHIHINFHAYTPINTCIYTHTHIYIYIWHISILTEKRAWHWNRWRHMVCCFFLWGNILLRI